MTLHCRDVQKNGSWGAAIKRDQCPSLDTPQKSCDNGAKTSEDTPDDPKLTTHHSGFRRACVCLVNSTWTRMRDSPREERRNHG
jgi:hypothetical protein